jgi:hypothetical protein
LDRPILRENGNRNHPKITQKRDGNNLIQSSQHLFTFNRGINAARGEKGGTFFQNRLHALAFFLSQDPVVTLLGNNHDCSTHIPPPSRKPRLEGRTIPPRPAQKLSKNIR